MKRASVISQELPDNLTLNYQQLLEEGIEALQTLAGDNWTDFNDHDPGVTILQQLCYALTDLGYRTEHPIEDILEPVLRDRSKKQAFFTGNEILACDPVTLNDYRKLLLNEITELRNVWIESVKPQDDRSAKSPDAHASELQYHKDYKDHYCVNFDYFDPPIEPLSESGNTNQGSYELQLAKNITNRIRELLSDNSSYGTHFTNHDGIYEIRPIPRDSHTLGDTELIIATDADPVNVIAAALFHVDLAINPYPAKSNIDTLLQQDHTPDEIFEGPLVTDGKVILDAELPSLKYAVSQDKVVGALRGVKDILKVNNAVFIREQEIRQGSMLDSVRVLNLDETICQLRITQGGKLVEKSDQTINLIKASFRHKQQQRRLGMVYAVRRLEDKSYKDIPRGNPNRKLDRYRSIQHLFPAIYGISEYGVAVDRWIEPNTSGGGREPATGPRARQAHARQLKAYLLFFEQLIADYLVQLANSARILSLDKKLDHTLFSQSLAHMPPRDDDPPDIVSIFVAELADKEACAGSSINYEKTGDERLACYQEGLERIRAEFDRPIERRGIALDHLLARFNHRFPNLDQLAGTYRENMRLKQRVNERKRDFLEQLSVLTRRRGSAAGYFAEVCEERKKQYSPTTSKADEGNHPPVRETLRCFTGYDGYFYILEHRSLKEPTAEFASQNNSLSIKHKEHGWKIHLVRRDNSFEWPRISLRGVEHFEVKAEFARDGIHVRARLRLQNVSIAAGDKHDIRVTHIDIADDFYSRSEADLGVRRLVELLKNGKKLDQYEIYPCWLPDPFFAPRLTVLLQAPEQLTSGGVSLRYPDKKEQLPIALESVVEDTLNAHLPAHLPVQCLWLDMAERKQLVEDLERNNDCVVQKISEVYCRHLIERSDKIFPHGIRTQTLFDTRQLPVKENPEYSAYGLSLP